MNNNANTIKENENEVLEVATVDVAVNMSPAMFENTQTAMFSSITGTDRATTVKVYNAINSSDNPISDNLGSVLEITDMVAHAIELEDEITKEKVQAMRVVLLTADGTSYHSVSQGVVSSLQKIIGIVGPAPWKPALKVVPVEVKTRKGFKTLTLQLQG